MRVLFVEPPKDFWFIMGEYVSPPWGISALAAYLENQNGDIEIGVIDCQAEKLGWKGLEERRFGEAYQEYMRRTPFLIPRFRSLVWDLLNLVILRLQQKGGSATHTRLRLLSATFISTSLLGLCLLAALTFKVPASVMHLPLQRQLTGSIFAAVCVFGSIAGVFPSRFARLFHFRKAQDSIAYKNGKVVNEEDAITFEGHHPTCGNFLTHILRFRGKTYCAGCTGLVTGAIIALAGSLLYSFNGMNAAETALLIFSSGFIGVACGLLQHNLSVKSSALHFSLNVAFVFGAFLLLVGVNALNDNLVLDSYLLTLIVYWIIARITLSKLEHERICAACDLKPCGLSFS